MSEKSRKSPILWVLLVAIAALGGVAAWVMTAPSPEKAAPGWTFISIQSGETELTSQNSPIIYSGDRLLARGPIVESRRDYVLLQDASKLENTASLARDAVMDDLPVRFSGVQLSRGKGRVRMVVIDTPMEIDSLPDLLKEANKTPGDSEKKLAALRAKLETVTGNESVKLITSPWYQLVDMPDRAPLPPPSLSSSAPAGDGK